MYVYFAKYDTPHFYDTLQECTEAALKYFQDYPYTRDTLFICEVLSAKRPVAPIVEIETVMISELKDLLESNQAEVKAGYMNSIACQPMESV